MGDDVGASNTFARCLPASIAAAKRAPNNPDALYGLAAIESSLGQREEALRHLDKAVDAGRLDYRSLELDPRFDSLHEDPRFRAVCQKMADRVSSLRLTVQDLNRGNP
jgi:tetratricopeptide (TPR) repeat protein